MTYCATMNNFRTGLHSHVRTSAKTGLAVCVSEVKCEIFLLLVHFCADNKLQYSTLLKLSMVQYVF